MLRRSHASAVATVLLAAAIPAAADLIPFRYTLEGAQEVPPVATAGTGHGVVWLDTTTRSVTCFAVFQNLVGTANNGHLHGLSAPGVNSSPIIQWTFTVANSGTAKGSGTLTAAQVTGLLNGLTYGNIHSTFKGGGEIRGQVLQNQCPADYNGDGFVDGIDADLFNNDFESSNPDQQMIADYNGDGFVDGIDYDMFNNDFETPCP